MNHWFEYPVRVQPHHTDYGGVAWHGSYIAWMEEARIAGLRSQGVEFADLVAIGCDLPVVKLAIQYHRSVRLGDLAIVKTRMQPIQGIRIVWDYEIYANQNDSVNSNDNPEVNSEVNSEVNVTAQVTLVPIDRSGKIMRRFPPLLKDTLAKMTL